MRVKRVESQGGTFEEVEERLRALEDPLDVLVKTLQLLDEAQWNEVKKLVEAERTKAKKCPT